MEGVRERAEHQEEAPSDNRYDDMLMDVDGGDVPFHNDTDTIPDVLSRSRSPSVKAEEVEDEERVWMWFIQTYPGQVAQTLGQAKTLFDSIRAEQEAQGLDPWAPFAG
jgi:hypothetical protein